MIKSSNNKTISVIIPAYNQAHFLGECIESVLRQSVKADEIIVVNDGATDNTSEVARRYPITLVEKENGGLSSARNAGIEVATSQFIQPLDSDDLLRPDAIKEHLKIADEKSIAQCGLLYFGTQMAEFRPQGATLETLLKTNTVYCNSVFPKKAWEDIGGYDESETMRLGLEDWLAWIEMAAVGYRVTTSDYISLLYRRHGEAMTKQTTHPHWNTIIKYMAERIKDKYGLETQFQKIVAGQQ